MYPSITIGTVYKTLDTFVKYGVINKGSESKKSHQGYQINSITLHINGK